MNKRCLQLVACIVTAYLVLITAASPSYAESRSLSTPESAVCGSALGKEIDALRPGDTLTLHAGLYTQTCALRVSAKGTREQPIVIAGARNDGNTVITVAQGLHGKLNTIELVDAQYLTLRNLHFLGGSMGVRIMGGHHITIENCDISGTQTAAVTMNFADSNHIVMRNNRISNTGNNPHASGEGIYIGCHDGSCQVTSSVFEHNTIFALRGNNKGGNDGIEIKRGSGDNIVRNNTISQLTKGGKYPAIFVHGGSEAVNLIENNVVTSSAEGIRVAGNSVVRNNLIYDVQRAGIVSSPHEIIKQVDDVTIVNNTVVNSGICAELDWRSSTNVMLANNALYCPGGTSLSYEAEQGVAIFNNAGAGDVTGNPSLNLATYPGRSIDRAFVNAIEKNFAPAPGGPLVHRALSFVPGMPLTDQRGQPRDQRGFASIGAIE